MSLATEKLSKILRMREAALEDFGITMNKKFGDKNVFSQIAELNDERVRKAVSDMGLNLDSSAEEVFQALERRVQFQDEALFVYLNNPVATTQEGCRAVAKLAQDIAGPTEGYFLKREVAERLLRKNPPRNLMKELRLETIDALLSKFRLEEIFPAVRFAEDPKWLNDVFFRPYESLTPDDFESREVEVVVLPEQWRDIGQKFSGHKLHHLSHLKELGVIFVMPMVAQDHAAPAGAILEILTLLLHYLVEVPYYSRLFRACAQRPQVFSKQIVSLLRGDVLSQPPPDHGSNRFLIIQRYLSKDDPSDPRLFAPHTNPEAMHWEKVEHKLAEFSKREPKITLGAWDGFGFVGDFFPLSLSREQFVGRGVGEEALISFDLIDNMISFNRQSSLFTKYLYHQQEALWNKVFEGWIGKEQLEKLVEDRLIEGYIEI